jgi:hypothetical protein
MSGVLKNPWKDWRIYAALLLLSISFFTDWNWLFWIGFAIIYFTDPGFRLRIHEPAGPLAFLLIPIAFYLWALYYHTPFNPVFPELLMVAAFIMFICIAFVIRKHTAKRQEILKDL